MIHRMYLKRSLDKKMNVNKKNRTFNFIYTILQNIVIDSAFLFIHT